MATEQAYKCISLPAGADLSATSNLDLWVEATVSGSGASSIITATIANAATDTLVGVLKSNGASGFGVQVAIDGVVKIKCGAAVTAGAYLTTDSSGRAVTAVSTNRYRGIAKTGSANANEVIEVLLIGANSIIA